MTEEFVGAVLNDLAVRRGIILEVGSDRGLGRQVTAILFTHRMHFKRVQLVQPQLMSVCLVKLQCS